MTQPDPLHEQSRWWRQAERDLDDARFAFEGARFNLACFLAQQSGEKAIKAYLYGAGRLEVRGHSVRDLCGEAAEIDPGFGTLGPRAAQLDPYYIPTRYPNGLPGGVPFEAFGREQAELALSLARDALAFVSGKLRRPPEPPAGPPAPAPG